MKPIMRNSLLGLCLLLPCHIVQSNPIALKYFSELQLDNQTRMGWAIELFIMWSEDSTMDGWYMTTSSDTAMLDSGIILSEGIFILLDEGTLQTPLSLSPSGETITLFNSAGYWMDELRYGDVENTETPSPPSGYSICLDYEMYHYWYLDSTPTLGAENDTSGAMSTIEGNIYDHDGNPLERARVRHAMTTQDVDSIYVTTDMSGYYTVDRRARLLYLDVTLEGYDLADTSFQAWPNTTHQVDFYLSPLVGIDDNESMIPEQIKLMQNYPNPFNASTSIEFGLPAPAHVAIDVFKLDGSHIATVLEEKMSAGKHEISWNAVNVPSGIYVYTIQVGDIKLSRKMILLK
ncbi:MAG: T9SS type A sorting domain-containing protein [FCB group bacterium]|nr:T9SS type A sorting domain-containing protein [FCB group bacterium]MBL7028303.1 T9SS type A sorting domain-containing protein [Candidatus Neomarinimicrobiota bacterium]MBL7121622.1 T9SS type A sorting domain-containing protein [Candidatus Neomarinimicrobiota bacterium]